MASLIKLADSLDADPALWKPLGGAPSPDWAIDSDPMAVADGRPFVDRVGFRSLLPRKGADKWPSCVLVTGESGDGKSYLYEFCCAFADGRDDLAIGYARAGANPHQMIPRTPATTLALALGVDFEGEPAVHEEPSRDAENLAEWILHDLPTRPVPAIAIFDEFGREGVSEAVHKFILTLVERVQRDDEYRAKLGIVLIDYDKARLSEADLDHEAYVLEAIEAKHVADWFRKRFPGKPDYRYEDTARSIIDRVAAQEQSQRMLTLNLQMQVAGRKFAGA